MKQITYLEQNNGIWEQYVVPIPEEDYEATRVMLTERGNKLDIGFDPVTGEEIAVPPIDVDPELTDAEKLTILEEAFLELVGGIDDE